MNLGVAAEFFMRWCAGARCCNSSCKGVLGQGRNCGPQGGNEVLEDLFASTTSNIFPPTTSSQVMEDVDNTGIAHTFAKVQCLLTCALDFVFLSPFCCEKHGLPDFLDHNKLATTSS